MPDDDLFASARAKLGRARVHHEELARFIGETLAAPGSRVPMRADKDPSSGYHLFTVADVPDLSDFLLEVGLRIGDTVNNLRGALDHAYWEHACARHGGEPPDPTNVLFPIWTTRKGLSKKVRAQVSSECASLILSHQPNPSEDGRPTDGRPDRWSGPYIHPLALLRQLTNTDKHRVTTPVLVRVRGWTMNSTLGVRYSFVSPAPVGSTVTVTLPKVETYPVESGSYVGHATLGGHLVRDHIEDIGSVNLAVAFADERRLVMPTLTRLAERVDLILGEMASLDP